MLISRYLNNNLNTHHKNTNLNIRKQNTKVIYTCKKALLSTHKPNKICLNRVSLLPNPNNPNNPSSQKKTPAQTQLHCTRQKLSSNQQTSTSLQTKDDSTLAISDLLYLTYFPFPLSIS